MKRITSMLLALSIAYALTACGKEPETKPAPEPERRPATEEKKETPVATFNPNATPEPEWVRNQPEKPAEPPEEAPETEPEEVSEPEPEPAPEDTPAAGIRPEFKELLDSYEAFFDSYAEFMQKYKESGNSAAMLTDYLDFMNQYLDMSEKLNALGEEEMNDEEAAYYLEVTLRISQKLLEVAQ